MNAVHHGLVVDGSDDIRLFIMNELNKLGYTCDYAKSRREAIDWLDNERFSFFVINVSIREGFGDNPSVYIGQELIGDILRSEDYSNLPIIALVPGARDLYTVGHNYKKNCEYLANSYIGLPLLMKPNLFKDEVCRVVRDKDPVKRVIPLIKEDIWETCQFLQDVSEKVMGPEFIKQRKKHNLPYFQEGIMEFGRFRVTLNGFVLCSKPGLRRQILDILCQQDRKSRYRSYTSIELAEIIGNLSGVKGIISCINKTRKVIVDSMRSKSRLHCGLFDVISNGSSSGYKFTKKIKVRIKNNKIHPDCRNFEQQLIHNLIAKYGLVRINDIRRQLTCSDSKVRNDLNCMVKRHVIEHRGPSNGGFYTFPEN